MGHEIAAYEGKRSYNWLLAWPLNVAMVHDLIPIGMANVLFRTVRKMSEPPRRAQHRDGNRFGFLKHSSKLVVSIFCFEPAFGPSRGVVCLPLNGCLIPSPGSRAVPGWGRAVSLHRGHGHRGLQLLTGPLLAYLPPAAAGRDSAKGDPDPVTDKDW